MKIRYHSDIDGATSAGLASIVMLLVVIAGAVGWVWNIVKFIGMLDGSITAMFVARAVGIIIAPFGSILGFF